MNWVDPDGLDPLNWSTGMTRAMQYQTQIIDSARRYGVPREVIAAALAHEMEWAGIQAPKAVVAGAIKSPWNVSQGIAQIKPATARQIDIDSGLTPLNSAEGYQAILKSPQVQIDYLTRNLLLAKKKIEKKMPKTNCDGMPEDAQKNLKWFIVIDAHNNPDQVNSWKWGPKYDGQVWKDLQDAYEGFGKR